MTPSELQQAKALADGLAESDSEEIRNVGEVLGDVCADVERLTRERDEARAASGIKDWAGDVRLAAKFAADLAACRTGAAAMVARVQEESQAHKERLAVVTADRDSLRALLVEACDLATEFAGRLSGHAHPAVYVADTNRISAILAAAGKVGE